jgi:hypothetical protein
VKHWMLALACPGKRWVLALACAMAMPAFAAAPTVLAPADAKALLAPPAKGARIVALWSLDCAYCEQNLAVLLAWQHAHADIDLVFVATDPISQRDVLEARLKTANVDGVPSRAYADATPERMNFLIDPSWGGETPRTLVVKADGSRKAVSGALDAGRIARLMD